MMKKESQNRIILRLERFFKKRESTDAINICPSFGWMYIVFLYSVNLDLKTKTITKSK